MTTADHRLDLARRAVEALETIAAAIAKPKVVHVTDYDLRGIEMAMRQAAEPPEDPAAEPWQCACLYARNTGPRCARCNRRPEQTWADGLEDPDVDQESHKEESDEG